MKIVLICYPFNFTIPRCLKIEIADAKGWDFVKAWCRANPEEQGIIKFVFQVNILVEDTEMKINNENEFESVAEECESNKK